MKQLKEEKTIESLERKQLKELKELERIEKEIKKQVEPHPLKKITYKDLSKGFVGALIGTSAHLVFLHGAEFAEHLSRLQATTWYLFSFFVGFVFLYIAGFKKVKQIKVFQILPLRVFTMFAISIVVITILLLLSGEIHGFDLWYKQVAIISLPAMIGACAADLIGGE